MLEILLKAVREGNIVAIELASQLLGRVKVVDLTAEQASALAFLREVAN